MFSEQTISEYRNDRKEGCIMKENLYYVYEQRGDVPNNNDLWIVGRISLQKRGVTTVKELESGVEHD